ncbi:MAG: hypothetical protein J6583_07150, partial [Gilliamella sp.]|nr:hypothetical protein [Gilliamella sp.]
CTKIVDIVNSSTGSIALTIMFYYMMVKDVGLNGIGMFIIEIITVWGIWGFHAYNEISSKNLEKKEAISIGLIIVLYVAVIFLFTLLSIKEFH